MATDAPREKAAPTPLPMRQILPIMIIQTVNTFSMTLVSPISPFMVQDFYPGLDPGDVGYYSGYVIGAYFLGQFFGSPLWGYLSDRFGRRPATILGTTGGCLSVAMFALSPNIYYATAMRLMWGMLNGNIVVVKTSLSELCDDSNQAKGMTVVTTCLGVGQMLGPSIGGLLARPASKWALFQGVWFFERFPYFLSCLPAIVLTFLGILTAAVFLPETHPDLGPRRRERQLKGIAVTDPERESSTPEPSPVCKPSQPTFDVKGTALRAFRCHFLHVLDRLSLFPILAYAVLGFSHIGFNTLFPLLLLNPISNHGFGYDTTAIGMLLAISGPIQAICAPIVFPWLTRRLGCRGILRWFSLVWAIDVFLIPFASLLPVDPPWIRYSVLAILYLIQGCLVVLCYTSVFLLINNSSRRGVRGRVNGLGQSGVSLARIFAPTAFSSIFALTQGSRLPWPINYHCAFVMIGLIGVSLSLGTRLLPPALDHLPEEVAAVEDGRDLLLHQAEDEELTQQDEEGL